MDVVWFLACNAHFELSYNLWHYQNICHVNNLVVCGSGAQVIYSE